MRIKPGRYMEELQRPSRGRGHDEGLTNKYPCGAVCGGNTTQRNNGMRRFVEGKATVKAFITAGLKKRKRRSPAARCVRLDERGKNLHPNRCC